MEMQRSAPFIVLEIKFFCTEIWPCVLKMSSFLGRKTKIAMIVVIQNLTVNLLSIPVQELIATKRFGVTILVKRGDDFRSI